VGDDLTGHADAERLQNAVSWALEALEKQARIYARRGETVTANAFRVIAAGIRRGAAHDPTRV
jgi:hypothetical protein